MNNKDKHTKRYTLTIEYNIKEDQCEYIQEELSEEVSSTKTYKIGTIDLRDYFTENELIGILNGKIAKS
tara:strand:- start:152 stop:358 length:207 start_codon:yes stop_codon:yes gene_type:complete